MNIETKAREAQHLLESRFPTGEARAMVRIIFEHLKHYSAVDMIIHARDPISDFIAGKVDFIVRRLLDNEPIQYIFGDTQFYGLTVKVTLDTLIPRPETAELVDMIVKDAGDVSDLRVLDIGTGSGCIALALARHLRFPEIEATDISEEALAVARENARSLKTRIGFRLEDALTKQAPSSSEYDIIVSNPPYIADSERESMEPNVLCHEPSTALFVPDSDPLLFYRAIGRYATQALKNGGRLYFEINPLYAEDLKRMIAGMGFSDVSVMRDSDGKNRFMSASMQR